MASDTYSTVLSTSSPSAFAPSQSSALLKASDASPTTGVTLLPQSSSSSPSAATQTAKTGGSSSRSRTLIIVLIVVGIVAALLLLLLFTWLWRRHRANKRRKDKNDPESEKPLQEVLYESLEDGYGGEYDKPPSLPRRWFSRVRDFWTSDAVGPYSRLQMVGSAFVVVLNVLTLSPQW